MRDSRLLLHICCAPDATVAIQRLQGRFEVSGFFPNPQIYPQDEFDLRRSEAVKLCKQWDVPILDMCMDPQAWQAKIQGFEREAEGGLRCQACIAFNLKKTAEAAQAEGIPFFSTSLTTSPRKDLKMIARIGDQIQQEIGIAFVFEAFRKQNGFIESVQWSKSMGLYRQRYCGCVYSMRQPA